MYRGSVESDLSRSLHHATSNLSKDTYTLAHARLVQERDMFQPMTLMI